MFASEYIWILAKLNWWSEKFPFVQAGEPDTHSNNGWLVHKCIYRHTHTTFYLILIKTRVKIYYSYPVTNEKIDIEKKTGQNKIYCVQSKIGTPSSYQSAMQIL